MRRWLILLVARMTPSCQQVCRCASEELEEPKSAWMRFKIWLHFRICHACELYANQLHALHKNLAQGSEDFRTDEKLTAEARERMRAAIRGGQGR